MSDTSPFGKIKSIMPKLVHVVYAACYADERLSFYALSLRSQLESSINRCLVKVNYSKIRIN
jgi:hypothetical protein